MEFAGHPPPLHLSSFDERLGKIVSRPAKFDNLRQVEPDDNNERLPPHRQPTQADLKITPVPALPAVINQSPRAALARRELVQRLDRLAGRLIAFRRFGGAE